MNEFQLFLDCDGVLADFDSFFEELAGEPSRGYEAKHGTKAFWRVIEECEDFFAKLPLMKDARRLYDTVKHLEPPILTGVPRGNWSQKQKLAWRDAMFPDAKMITCPSKDKYKHMVPGKLNIIVDDWAQYKHIWEENGGVFILHTSVDDSLAELKRMGVL